MKAGFPGGRDHTTKFKRRNKRLVHLINYREFLEAWGRMKLNVLVAQPCPTLCNPMDCSSPDSSVYGISQARILEWVTIPFSRGSPRPRD